MLVFNLFLESTIRVSSIINIFILKLHHKDGFSKFHLKKEKRKKKDGFSKKGLHHKLS